MPSHHGKLPDPSSDHDHAFGPEKRSLQFEIPSVAAQRSSSRDDPVAWHLVIGATAHDVSDGPARARATGHVSHVAVG
jgi:hypothetical protein